MTTATKSPEPTKGHLTDQIAEGSIKKQSQQANEHPLSRHPADETSAQDERAIDEADARANTPANQPRHVPGPTPPATADAAHYDNLHAGGWTPAEIAARAVTDLESISISPGGVTFVVGDTKQLAAHGSFKGQGHDPHREITQSITWVSDRPAVASVNGSGLITAISAGTATLTATNANRNATVNVTVKAPVVAPAP
jgi:uncharacterized protein YjdB